MMPTAIYPDGLTPDDIPLSLSPAVLSNGHLFVTGMTGSRADGTMPEDPREQFVAAFKKIDAVLQAAGAGLGALVEMTSYHVDISVHFDSFAAVQAQFVSRPFPAWTAIGVAELRRPGALVEIRATAHV